MSQLHRCGCRGCIWIAANKGCAAAQHLQRTSGCVRAAPTAGAATGRADPAADVAGIGGGCGNSPRSYPPPADETDNRAGSATSKATCGADAAVSAVGLPGSTPTPSSCKPPNGLTSEGSACCLAIIFSKSGIQSVMSMSSSSSGSSLILFNCERVVSRTDKNTAQF